MKSPRKNPGTCSGYHQEKEEKMKVSMQTTLNASADKVWQVVGDFNGLPAFVAAATKSRMEGDGVGALRTLTLPDGAEIVERLETYDDEARTLTYSIVSGPLPVANYLSMVEVTPLADGQCRVKWSSTFEAAGASEEEARSAIEGIYAMGFEGLHKLYDN
jgi:mxaD protein